MTPFPLRTTLLPLRFIAARERDWRTNVDASRLEGDWFQGAVKELIQKGIVTPINSDVDDRLAAIEWDQDIQEIAGVRLEFAALDSFYRSHGEIIHAWVEAYRQLAHSVRYCPEDHSRLAILDAEMAVLPKVLEYLYTITDGAYDIAALQFAIDISYFLYVRGAYARQVSSHKIALKAVDRLRLRTEQGEQQSISLTDLLSAEAMEIAFEVEWLTRQAKFAEIMKNDYLKRLDELTEQHHVPLHPSARIVALVSIAYYHMENPPSDLERAQDLLQAAVTIAGERLASLQENAIYDEAKYVTQFTLLAKYRIAQCLAAADPASAVAYMEEVLKRRTD